MANVQNARDYQRFVGEFTAFYVANGAGRFSAKNSDAEPFFSWHACECCGDTHGGMREEYTNGMDTFNICEDCVYFLEYNVLDDVTMAKVRMIE